MRLSLRPGRGSAGRGGPAPGEPRLAWSRPPPGKASRVGLSRPHGEGRAGQDPPGKFLGRSIPLGVGVRGFGCVTVQGSKRGLCDRACRGRPGHGAPTRVRQGIPELGGAESLPWGGNLLSPPPCFKEGRIILRERSGGARGLGAGCAQMGAEPLK